MTDGDALPAGSGNGNNQRDAAKHKPPTRETADRGRVAGIDYGSVRIGIAISDPQRIVASPHENYTRRGNERDSKYFRRLVDEERVTLFVVGLPVHLDGRESEKSQEARSFGQWLGEMTGVPVVFYDERFSTSEAEGALLEAGMSKKRRKKRLDMLSAQIMLAAYLESDQNGAEGAGGIDD